MIRFRALGVHFSLPLLTLIMPVLATRLGMQGSAGPLMLALAVHELGHLGAARLARVEIVEIRLMPFGGCARIENPYGLRPVQLAVTAAAGPAMNLLCTLCIAAFAQWRFIRPSLAAALIQPQWILMLFNLLPAQPLDGGRMLYALLLRPLGEARAFRICLLMGRMVASVLLGSALWGGLSHGKWNLTLILAGIFMLASQRDEREALGISRLRRMDEVLQMDDGPHPAHFYQLDASTDALCALKLLRSREREWFLLTQDGKPYGMIDGGSIVRYLVQGGTPQTPLRQLCACRFSPVPGASCSATG